MNLFIRILSPRLGAAVRRLADTLAIPKHTRMSTLTTEEEISVIDTAAQTITDLRAALKTAVQQVTPHADENLKLREAIRTLEDADAASDAALSRLRDRLNEADLSTPPAETDTGRAEGNPPAQSEESPPDSADAPDPTPEDAAAADATEAPDDSGTAATEATAEDSSVTRSAKSKRK